jgi:hypothetical protein
MAGVAADGVGAGVTAGSRPVSRLALSAAGLPSDAAPAIWPGIGTIDGTLGRGRSGALGLTWSGLGTIAGTRIGGLGRDAPGRAESEGICAGNPAGGVAGVLGVAADPRAGIG